MKEEERMPWALGLIYLLRIAVLGLLAALTLTLPAAAAQRCLAASAPVETVIPVGKAVGIKLFSRGVMVVGLSEIETDQGPAAPARDCGLLAGDIITCIDSEEVYTIDQVADKLQQLQGEEMSLRVVRGGRTLQLEGEAAQCCTDGSYKLGAWIRDSMAGIGTVTWYDPQSGQFAALGHGITDVDTGLLVPIQSGAIMSAQVTDVISGGQGSPGQLHGRFDLEHDLGQLTVNADSGIFGTAPGLWEGTPVELARRREVKTGPATILANISGDEVEEYTVEIVRIYPAALSDTRNLLVKVTDQRLLDSTGGIVQGMSGSPILQNGKLVGAVTHVLLEDPTRGYGILAENMMKMAG